MNIVHVKISRRERVNMGLGFGGAGLGFGGAGFSCAGFGGFTSTAAILVLFILLVIISRSFGI
jgi:hypothetical protein